MKNHYLLFVLMAALSLIPAGGATAQTFTTLYSFTGGSDGKYPDNSGYFGSGGLLLSGNTLYGAACYGGTGGNGAVGTVFSVNTDGTGFTVLYSAPTLTSEGCQPSNPLILSGNTLYGTSSDGPDGNGTVFALNTDGTGFTGLYDFSEGCDCNPYGQYADPASGVILSGNTLYGTSQGGPNGNGMVFALNTDGTGFTELHDFSATSGENNTNSDGADPSGPLVLSGNTLYGTAGGGGPRLGKGFPGGSYGYGTVFAINTDGTGFTTLHNFAGGSDGGYPVGGLILSGNTLYGASGSTVFAINTDGSAFTTLLSVGSGAGLFLSGDTLYGTAGYTVFAVKTNGTGFTTLYNVYTNVLPGDIPVGGVILYGNTLYGMTGGGYNAGYGKIFSVTLPVSPPPLTITASATNVVLSWPTNFTGFTLQSATNLVSPAVWTPVSPAPLVVNGQNIVTNPISGTQQFYRLQE